MLQISLEDDGQATHEIDLSHLQNTDDQNLSLTTDSLLIEDGTGVKLADLAKEPWFGDDDDAGATTNTEDIYHLGQSNTTLPLPTTN